MFNEILFPSRGHVTWSIDDSLRARVKGMLDLNISGTSPALPRFVYYIYDTPVLQWCSKLRHDLKRHM